MIAHAEIDTDSPFREVLFRAWEETRMYKDHKDATADWILNASLELLIDLYTGVDFVKVMN